MKSKTIAPFPHCGCQPGYVRKYGDDAGHHKSNPLQGMPITSHVPLPHLVADQRPQLVQVDDGLEILVLPDVKVPHTNLHQYSILELSDVRPSCMSIKNHRSRQHPPFQSNQDGTCQT